MEAKPHHARQRNAGNLTQVERIVDGVRRYIGIGADSRFTAAARISQVFQHFLVSVNADITGMIFEIGASQLRTSSISSSSATGWPSNVLDWR